MAPIPFVLFKIFWDLKDRTRSRRASSLHAAAEKERVEKEEDAKKQKERGDVAR
jgi:hypothetical protein